MEKETMAAELKAEVGRIAFDINDQMTRLLGVSQSLEALGARIFALKSHNLDIASAAGLLTNSVQDDLRSAMNRVRLAYKSLEDYKNIP